MKHVHIALLALGLVLLAGTSPVVAEEAADSALKSPGKMVASAKAQITEMPTSSLKSIKDSGKKIVLIDVRTEREYMAGHIQGAVWVPRGVLEFKVKSLADDPQDEIVVYCRSGGRSALSAQTLRDMGFTNTSSLEGGFRQWVNDGNSAYNRHGEIKIVAFEKEENPKQ